MTARIQLNKSSECPECGASTTSEFLEGQVFEYGLGEAAVALSAEVPILTCDSCGFEFTDHRGETARHDAICRHLGVMTPHEIVAIREGLRLSRSDFAELGGFGIASLQRWESGTVIQNQSIDRLIFLLRFPLNGQRLDEQRRLRAFGDVDIDAAASPALQDEATAPVTFSSLSLSTLAADESVMKTSGIFTGLLNSGELFQCLGDSCLQ